MNQKQLMMLGLMGVMSMGIVGCGAFDSDSMDGVLPSVANNDTLANSEDESVIPTSAMPAPASKCHVEALSNGARIWCEDGSSVSVFNGQAGNVGSNGIDGIDGVDGNNGLDGQDGADGHDGVAGFNGADGQDAQPCTAEQTLSGATLSCPDGSSAYVLNGVDGVDGINGLDGSDGIDGIDGMNGIDGVDGVDGLSCTVVQVASGAEIQCSDGTVASILNGLDGIDGLDGTSCSVTTASAGSTITCSDGTTASILNGVDGLAGTDGLDGADTVISATLESSAYQIMQLSNDSLFLINTASTNLSVPNVWLLSDGITIPALLDSSSQLLYSTVVYHAAEDTVTFIRASDLYNCTLTISTNVTECVAPVVTLPLL